MSEESKKKCNKIWTRGIESYETPAYHRCIFWIDHTGSHRCTCGAQKENIKG